MTPKTKRVISWLSTALFVGGAGVAYWGMRHFSQLANFQRIGMLLPIVWAIPLMYGDTFANWPSASSYDRIKAGGSLFNAALLSLGCLGWYLAAPGAQAGN